jgi:hypothetical protein
MYNIVVTNTYLRVSKNVGIGKTAQLFIFAIC